ncbi:proline dehydrogenase family protein [Galbibacter sp. PAP.153]|uniref:proline dehydrogenase family protein n=1 Tax=Galbibacter sp. PAP.153 TaxID=3104623 RepID=UPI00300BD164
MNKIFNNTERAFALKSDSQLQRAYFLFRMIAIGPLVRTGSAVTNFALRAHLPIEGMVRRIVFDHFCGGVSEKDCLPVIGKMYEKGVNSILDYSAEGKEAENQFDDAMDKIVKVIDFAKDRKSIPFAVFKPTALGRFGLYQKVTEKKALDEGEQLEWERVEKRYHEVCSKAHKNGVAVLIDAEESWMQDAVDDLVLKMMRTYNRERAIVFNTLQMYRWDRLDYMKELIEISDREKIKVGIKIVRGAYMEKENERALVKGYPSPICESKEDTDLNFDRAVELMSDHLDKFSIFLGTHNEYSTYRLMDLMAKLNIGSKDPRVWFGQLYGMSDHITYNLADSGYLVAKYLPYGPVRDVMPYLIRRAEENTSVSGQTSRELFLIKKEKARRRLNRKAIA